MKTMFMSPTYRQAPALSIKLLIVLLTGATALNVSSKALGAGEDLFVTDLSTNSIVAYSPDGTKRTFATGLNSPQGLAFDHTGNLYEADFGSGNIYKFTADGTRSTFVSGLMGPIGLAFDSSGNLLVAENTGNRIDRFAMDGSEDLFASVTAPTAITFDNPRLFVANANSVVSFDGPEASPSPIPSLVPMNVPSPSVTVDFTDAVYVSDGNGKITKVKDNLTKSFAQGLSGPSNMAWDHQPDNRNLVVADTLAGKIFKYTVDGAQSTFATGGSPNFIALEPTLPGKLLNISTRGGTLTGDNVLIGGFIITGGNVPKKVLIRAIGPSLNSFGVLGALADPVLELHMPDGTIVTNDNWKSDHEADIQGTGLAPTNDLESAILVTLLPVDPKTDGSGHYTAVVRGQNNGTGVALVEVYDLDDPALPAELGNISTRGFVDTGDNVMIGGFIIKPDGDSARVLVRAIGPTLANSNVPNPLEDPTLELHDVNGNTISNNDWADTAEGEIQATGLAPTDARESAILINLSSGNYTAIVRGNGNTTGVALVEIYHIK